MALEPGKTPGGLGPLLGAFLVAGNTIGAGIFLIPASLGLVGSISILGWLIATAGAAALGLVFSCLVRLRPSGAGLFDFIGEGLGPAAGFITGVLYWCPLQIAPAVVALTGYLGFFFPSLTTGVAATVTSVSLVWLFVGANLIGPRFIALMSGGTLAIGLAPIILVTGVGLFHVHPDIFAASWNITGKPALAVTPSTAVTAFFGFIGMEVAAVTAPLMRNPDRTVPIATLGGIGVAGLVYIASSAVIMGILPAAALAKSTAPFADAARPMLGASIAAVLAVCALAKVGGTLGVVILACVETADSPAVLGRLVPIQARAGRRGPSRANLLIIGCVLSGVIIASASPTLGRQFAIVADISVVLTLVCYLTASLALLRFSRAAPPGLRRTSRIAGAIGALFSVGCIAASEPGLLIYSAATIALAGLAWLGLRPRWLAAA